MKDFGGFGGIAWGKFGRYLHPKRQIICSLFCQKKLSSKSYLHTSISFFLIANSDRFLFLRIFKSLFKKEVAFFFRKVRHKTLLGFPILPRSQQLGIMWSILAPGEKPPSVQIFRRTFFCLGRRAPDTYVDQVYIATSCDRQRNRNMTKSYHKKQLFLHLMGSVDFFSFLSSKWI